MVKVLTSRLHSVSAGKWRGGELYLTSTWLACYTIPGFGSNTTGCYSLLCSLFSTSTTPSGQSHSPSQATVIPVPKTVLMCIVFCLISWVALQIVFCQVKMTSPFPSPNLCWVEQQIAQHEPDRVIWSTVLPGQLTLMITIGNIFNLWVTVKHNRLSHGLNTLYFSGLYLDTGMIKS